MRPAELNQLKAMVTMPYVNERAAYGRNKERHPHIASFCGTGNNVQFLTDPTGNRRWLPFEVSQIRDRICMPSLRAGLQPGLCLVEKRFLPLVLAGGDTEAEHA